MIVRLRFIPLASLIVGIISGIAGCKTAAKNQLKADEASADNPSLQPSPAPSLSQPVNTTTTDPVVSLNSLLAHNNTNGVHLVPMPLVRQSRNYTCGVAATQSVLHYWGDEFREGPLARKLKSSPTNGTSYLEIVSFVNDLNDPVKRKEAHATLATDEEPGGTTGGAGANLVDAPRGGHGVQRGKPSFGLADAPVDPYTVKVYPGKATQMRSIIDAGEAGVPKDGISSKELEGFINEGHPVIVLVQAWRDGTTPQWIDDADDGHYVVVIGYDKSNFYLMDPSTTGNYAYVPRPEFLLRWHDVDATMVNGATVNTPVRHFGLVIYRSHPAWDFDNTTKMD